MRVAIINIPIPQSWERNFLFTAGSIRPARGLEDVLWAIKHLASRNTEIEGIVIAGEAPANMIPYQRRHVVANVAIPLTVGLLRGTDDLFGDECKEDG